MIRDQARRRLLCALDTTRLLSAAALAAQLEDRVGGLKLGNAFFGAHGPPGVRTVAGERHRVFLDLKFHDIPATVAGGVRAVTALRPFLLTVHAAGGPAMMRAAVAAAREAGKAAPRVIAVTVLTSMDADDLDAVGIRGPVDDRAARLADLAQDCGADGVVCSPHEAGRLRRQCGLDFILVTPGIRLPRARGDDQKRVLTPGEAFAAGASYLVVGRPIAQADDPVAAVERIVDDMIAG